LSQLQESVLFDQLHEGNPRAVEHLYERYRGRLLRFCIRLLGDDSIAEDIVQNVFEKLQKQSATIRSVDGLQSWLFTVARNEAFGG
jgi:RNA polymerase sigma-70 factor (ECF subfamily)